MIKISHVVEDIIHRSPFLAEALSENIANISSVARRIRPQVEKKLLEKVSEEAIAMALRRMPTKTKAPMSGIKFLKQLSNMTVRSHLVEFVFPHGLDHTKLHQDLLKQAQQKHDAFVHLSRGLFESIIIVSSDLEEVVERMLARRKHVVKFNDLSSITIKLPAQTISTPGVYYPILKALAWEGINIIEVISIGTELSIIFKSSDANRAFSVLSVLTS